MKDNKCQHRRINYERISCILGNECRTVDYKCKDYLGDKLKNEQLYSSAEVAVMIGIKQQSVARYFRDEGIGTKDRFNNLLFTKGDIELIKATDGRKK